MTRKPLPFDEISYESPVLSALELEDLVQNTRARHQKRLKSLAGLSREHRELKQAIDEGFRDESPEVKSGISGFFSRLFRSPPAVSAADLLETRLELAQRRVLQVAHHLDRLSLDRSAIHREIEGIHKQIGAVERDSNCAAELILKLKPHVDELGADPTEQALIESRLLEREAELRSFQRTKKRLTDVMALNDQFLELTEQLHINLSELHDAASTVLRELDLQLARVAAEAQARDIARAMSDSMGSLRDSVARVNRIADEGAVLLTENLDRLSDEVNLLSPTDQLLVEAEKEVNVFLRNQTVDDAVRRARQQVALKEQMDKITNGGES
ncbi:MAG: hypothetical protein HN348_04230 [Proteobacteria bacterium]|nr:hypothetical protein [Pseudomonadota bacterium]